MKLLTSIVGLAVILLTLQRPASAQGGRGAAPATYSRPASPARPSIRRATGCRSSPTTGASAWCRLRKATTRASRSRWRGRKSPTRGIRRRTKPTGNQCKHYGAASIMYQPTRLHITWQDDNTLRVDTDAGTQTRVFQFGKPAATPGKRTWQGNSVAIWEARRANNQEKSARYLKVTTTNMLAGYLRKNGVPYGDSAVPDRVLRSVSGTRRHDDDVRHGCRAGSGVSGAAIHRDLALQERAGRIQVGSHAMFGEMVNQR